MEDRASFPAKNTTSPDGYVVMATGDGGALYSYFELTLPKGSHIWGSKSNAIVIDTDRFTLSIAIDFRGFGTLIPFEYK